MEARIILKARHDFGDAMEGIRRIKTEADFSLVVLEGIQAMQRAQKILAPRGKGGNIPRSIQPARITKTQSTWSGLSKTTYGPAVFTNEGTGIHGPSGMPYPITQNRTYQSGPNKGNPYQINISHPGIRGTHWWEAGAELGSKIALEAFRRKIARMMR